MQQSQRWATNLERPALHQEARLGFALVFAADAGTLHRNASLLRPHLARRAQVPVCSMSVVLGSVRGVLLLVCQHRAGLAGVHLADEVIRNEAVHCGLRPRLLLCGGGRLSRLPTWDPAVRTAETALAAS